MRAAFIGFSEAGSAFARSAVQHGAFVSAFDLRSLDAATAGRQTALCARVGVECHDHLASALAGADIVVSTVTAGAALAVAQDAAHAMTADQVFLDLNSVSPATKSEIRDTLRPFGIRFVEGVAMGRVVEDQLPPVLLSGPFADGILLQLRAMGWPVENAGRAWGTAPAVKLLRSAVVKGMEALLVEAFGGAARVGGTAPLLATLGDWLPGVDWPEFARYHLERVARHGRRRSEELAECAAFLDEIGAASAAVRGAAQTQSGVSSSDPVFFSCGRGE